MKKKRKSDGRKKGKEFPNLITNYTKALGIVAGSIRYA